MAPGFQVTKDGLNQRVGALVVAGEAWFDDVRHCALYLSTAQDSDLIALGLTASDVTAIKGAVVDLENLRLTAYGQRAQTPASNFLFNAVKLRGML